MSALSDCLLVCIVYFPTYPFFFTFSLLISSLFLREQTRSASRPDVVKEATKPGFSFVCVYFVLQRISFDW